MKHFVEILKQFTQPQRLIVLILLLVTVILIQYFKTDDCSSLVHQNRLMQEDFVKISQLLREEMMKVSSPPVMVDSTVIYTDTISIIEPQNAINEQILEIVNSHIKE